jgi:hypothetical protein
MKTTLAQILAEQVQATQPQGWAKRVYPMPAYDPFARDNIFRAPTAPGTQTLNFDKMGYSEPEWYLMRGRLPRMPEF